MKLTHSKYIGCKYLATSIFTGTEKYSFAIKITAWHQHVRPESSEIPSGPETRPRDVDGKFQCFLRPIRE